MILGFRFKAMNLTDCLALCKSITANNFDEAMPPGVLPPPGWQNVGTCSPESGAIFGYEIGLFSESVSS